ncbi:MAG: class I SAM-dependent rRNA methyltransferase [Phycisphaerales bacterium]|nr:class I SAM-dependent rRNA methyltransferase [Phycisphaerales bacterium]
MAGSAHWQPKLSAALQARAELISNHDAVRLVHDRADGFDGLVIERFGPVLIAQIFEERWAGSDDLAREIATATMNAVGAIAVYRKRFPRERSAALARLEAEHTDPQPWVGRPSPAIITITENGLPFEIHPFDGYSTGLFLEHRDTRLKVRAAANGARVLNAFSYTCGFSVFAAAGGAATVVSVDVSRKYLEWGRRNLALNNLALEGHRFLREDVMTYLARAARRGDEYDLIVLDPPTFGRSKDRGRAFSIRSDLGRLLELAASLLAPRGRVLLSSNHRGTSRRRLVEVARQALGQRFLSAEPCPLPLDFAGDSEFSKHLFVETKPAQSK